MTWRRPGDKPLSEPTMVRLPTHICVTRPQLVNGMIMLHLLLRPKSMVFIPGVLGAASGTELFLEVAGARPAAQCILGRKHGGQEERLRFVYSCWGRCLTNRSSRTVLRWSWQVFLTPLNHPMYWNLGVYHVSIVKTPHLIGTWHHFWCS